MKYEIIRFSSENGEKEGVIFIEFNGEFNIPSNTTVDEIIKTDEDLSGFPLGYPMMRTNGII